MSKWINQKIFDAFLSAFTEADELALCAGQPSSYYNVVNPPAWIAGTAYSLTDSVRPMVDRNGFTYECTTAGTSGENEPVWPVTDGQTVTDGTAVWTARTCLACVTANLVPADFVISNGDAAGSRKLTVLPKTGMTAYSSLTADHVVLIDNAEKKLLMVTLMAEQAITSGNLVNVAAIYEEIGAPV